MMVSLLEQQRIVPVLMTLPPIDPDRYVEHLCRSGFDRFTIMYWLEDTERMYHVQQAYSDRIREIASDTGARLLDIRTGFLKAQDYGTLLCKDGIHPNEEGRLLIWNTLHDYLKCCRTWGGRWGGSPTRWGTWCSCSFWPRWPVPRRAAEYPVCALYCISA